MKPQRYVYLIGPAIALYLLLIAACLGLTAGSGCTGSQRQKTLHATVLGLNVARDGFVAWDSDHQAAIVEKATSKEEGQKALDDYRAKRQEVIAAFEAAYRVAALAATQADDVSLSQALAAAASVQKAYDLLKGGE